MAAGARTLTNIDVSAPALDLARQNMALNNLDSERVDYLQADVFKQLRSFRDAARQFDVIILDPPKFADSKQQLDHASRGYKDINLLAAKLLRSGGHLFTFSCSGLMEPALFQKIVADAALDAGRDAQIIGRMGQAADHPIIARFSGRPLPEGTSLPHLVAGEGLSATMPIRHTNLSLAIHCPMPAWAPGPDAPGFTSSFHGPRPRSYHQAGYHFRSKGLINKHPLHPPFCSFFLSSLS